MKIKILTLSHYRRFTDFSMDFDPNLTVLVAKNGAGKTSILDAIATLLGTFLTRLPKISGYNPKETDFQVYPNGRRPPYMRIKCESFNGIKWDRTEKRDQSTQTLSEIPEALGIKQLNDYVDSFIDADNAEQPYQLPVFIYYGTGRGVFDIPQRKRNFSKEFRRFDALSGALESRTNFRSFVEYFYHLEEQENRLRNEKRSFDVELPELKAIRTAVQRILPSFSNPRSVHPAGIEVDWQPNGETKQLRIEQLSDGYRTTLAMVMDIAARMAEANPDMPDPLETEGVVLIDEVDLHLHPGWQQTILLDLMDTFKNIQFIVSTHSPQVISSVKPGRLRVIDWQHDQPVLIPVDFAEGAESQQVLLDVLGVKSPRVQRLEIVQNLQRYQDLVKAGKWDSPEALTLRTALDEWGAEHEPELARLDIDIRLHELDR
ncbi:AAA family ATPase [Thiothrix sp.]|jgi:predicted ATP-binding protein involved in virulence|uniref:AAA family ATPase n=1 Tax=Thiothrix sp. TaxID=1032 RepID=UPI00257A2A61|nr:AAA family ATPase [Thiothrix sp.]